MLNLKFPQGDSVVQQEEILILQQLKLSTPVALLAKVALDTTSLEPLVGKEQKDLWIRIY